MLFFSHFPNSFGYFLLNYLWNHTFSSALHFRHNLVKRLYSVFAIKEHFGPQDNGFIIHLCFQIVPFLNICQYPEPKIN